jgi:hypothetical protein
MIDLNKIRSMKTLENMKKSLSEFVNFDHVTMVSVYTEEFGWDEEDFEADKESATQLLEKVEKRMKSLGKFLSKEKKEKIASDSAQIDSASS